MGRLHRQFGQAMTDSRDASARAIFRSIESNLRALCVDVRRRNPEVKTLAEQVILQLKEADSDEAFTKAADAAAAVFCAACAANAKSSGAPTYAAADQKAVTTAVTCLHKLVTHHAVSSASLPPILDAVERLGVASVDDNISLKVLQTNISLLSRHYTKVLSEDDLARAFALFFRLKTAATSLTAVANASTALSAISSMATGKGDGVIELTSRAAFRQVTAYLFSAASDATPDGTSSASTSGSRTSSSVALNSSPIEVRAAYRLFQDLCALLAGERLLWLANDKADSPPELAGLDNVFILEVVDDALSDNSRLFRQNGLFADLVTERLAPAIHSKIIFGPEKPVLKALLSVSATLLRGFWEELGGGCKSLLRTISDKARMQDGPARGGRACTLWRRSGAFLHRATARAFLLASCTRLTYRRSQAQWCRAFSASCAPVWSGVSPLTSAASRFRRWWGRRSRLGASRRTARR